MQRSVLKITFQEDSACQEHGRSSRVTVSNLTYETQVQMFDCGCVLTSTIREFDNTTVGLTEPEDGPGR